MIPIFINILILLCLSVNPIILIIIIFYNYSMCTAVNFKNKYFGRNLDLEFKFKNEIVITPRNFCFNLLNKTKFSVKFAIIGMAIVVDNYPLYFDAMNENGLAIAALNFNGYAKYNLPSEDKINITTFEFIPFLLGSCKNLTEAIDLIAQINLTNQSFSNHLPLTPLHWIITDLTGKTITIESTTNGLEIIDNQVGVLTNSPNFNFHIQNLSNYCSLTNQSPKNNFANYGVNIYSRGMGAIGLPGDFSSASRFIKATFVKKFSVCGDDTISCITQFFKILNSVAQVNGNVITETNEYEYTIYSSCMDLEKSTYYYQTYNNSQISAVELKNNFLNSDKLITYPLVDAQKINFQN